MKHVSMHEPGAHFSLLSALYSQRTLDGVYLMHHRRKIPQPLVSSAIAARRL